MSRREWHLPWGMWLLFGPLILLCGAVCLLSLIAPLFPDARREPLWFVFPPGALLFGWMTGAMWKAATGLFVIIEGDNLIVGDGAKNRRFVWSDITALWTQSNISNTPLYLRVNGQSVIVFSNLSNFRELRALIEEKTGLPVVVSLFGPPTRDTLITMSGATIMQERAFISLLTLLLVGGSFTAVTRFYFSYLPWFDSTQRLLTSICVLIGFVVLLGVFGRILCAFVPAWRARKTLWTFDHDAITQSSNGHNLVLPVEQIESLEHLGWYRSRVRGANLLIVLPHSASGRAGEFLAWRTGLKWQHAKR